MSDPALCRHRTVPHPLPERMPTVRSDQSNTILWVPAKTMFNPPTLGRCLDCGLVGELAKEQP